ncbi:MAG: KOW domain-containing RNA-binding protein [Oscillospiraceae bacterium]|nr:KOW domain-containing RNA-binding protein [Oscillospiraceae bacterium]
MDIFPADIVMSTAGRDQEHLFYVLEVQDDYVLYADGRGRKMESPKRKKIKHIKQVARVDTRVAEKLRKGEKVLNSELRRDLADFGQKLIRQDQGG